MTYRKKLIEVALPLEAINRESAREKSIRYGHPSTLHLWWARRPLAACRAVLFASLVDDPDSDPTLGNWAPADLEQRRGEKRQDLFDLIEQLVKWENSNNESVIRSARAEIARCVASRKIETGELKKDQSLAYGITPWDLIVKGHVKPIRSGKDVAGFDTSLLPKAEAVDAFLAEHASPVLDPFAGGGSIPLEAQRLGLRAYASDLNPVPVLINKALIEIPPKFAGKPPVNPKANARMKGGWIGATGLADDVRYYGKWMRDQAEKRIGHLYPKVEVTAEMTQDRPDLIPYIGQQLTVIAWLWARTVASPNPAAKGAHVPLVRSFWLSTKADKKVWVEPVVDRAQNRYEFKIRMGNGTPHTGTVGRSGGTCLLTESPMPLDHIRAEGKAGRIGARLMTIVADCSGGRVYIPPTGKHEQIAGGEDPRDVPDTNLPEQALGFRVQNYGMVKHRHLFTRRQLVALTTFCDLLGEVRELLLVHADGDQSYANAIATYLGLGIGRLSDICNSLCGWETSKTQVRHLFTRHAISMLWDFGENNVFGNAAGDFGVSVENLCRAIDRLPANGFGHSEQRNAEAIETPSNGYLISTDPPYYDNVPYADLSDFFYVWLRRCLQSIYPELLGTVLVPKAEELVAEPFRHGGRQQAREFFELGMERVFRRVRIANDPNYPTTIYYAFKQSQDEDDGEDGDDATASHSSTGWETFLQGLVEAGWQIDGTWPMRTELANRMRGIGSNALASSVILVCRPRSENASLVTRKDFITALRRELPDALRNLQRGNIAPVDLAQAAIGPGMAVFTRYAKVIESAGSSMTVRTALGIINQSLDEVLAEQEGEFDTDTRWAVAWFEQFGMEEGAFGMAETLSKAKNTAVNGLEEAGIIRARSGKVRLLKREELSTSWGPTSDNMVSAWEVTQYLIHALETGGETAAATLLRKLGGFGETARDLAYRLFHICERKGWASEAISYNGLVIAWPELSRLARQAPAGRTEQSQLPFS
jgi:putative DNA methylase